MPPFQAGSAVLNSAFVRDLWSAKGFAMMIYTSDHCQFGIGAADRNCAIAKLAVKRRKTSPSGQLETKMEAYCYPFR